MSCWLYIDAEEMVSFASNLLCLDIGEGLLSLVNESETKARETVHQAEEELEGTVACKQQRANLYNEQASIQFVECYKPAKTHAAHRSLYANDYAACLGMPQCTQLRHGIMCVRS